MGHINYGPSWFQNQSFGQFAPADLAILGFAYLALINRFAKGWFTVSQARRQGDRAWPRPSWPWARWSASSTARTTRSATGATWSMGALFAFALWSTVLRSEEGCFRFAQLFVGIVGAYGAVQLIQFMRRRR